MARILARENAALAAFPDVQGQGRRYQEAARAATRAIPGRPGDTMRFWAKIVIVGEHWAWAGGYVRGRPYCWWRGGWGPAARVSWIVAHGEIPPGMYVRHACDGDYCLNPDHLVLSHRRNGPPHAPPPGKCSQCERPALARGMCKSHLSQFYKRRKKEKAMPVSADPWKYDLDEGFRCWDCRRSLDDIEAGPTTLVPEEGAVHPICGRCFRTRRLRLAAAEATDPLQSPKASEGGWN